MRSNAGYYGYEECRSDLLELRTRFPLWRGETIGTSACGRPIEAIRIGTGRINVQVNASFHANEWITSMLLMRFAEEWNEALEVGAVYLEANPRSLREDVTLWLVPMVNPDGVELCLRGIVSNDPFYDRVMRWNGECPDFSQWKANIRGVDLNDQFPAFWEEEASRRSVHGPGPRDYGGEAPLTEPESIAMAAFTGKVGFDCVIALHTQGEEIYWNYRGYEPADALDFATELGKASGYKPVYLENSDAGYKDWFIQEYRRPGFTVEAGFGVNPLPLSQFSGMHKQVSALLARAVVVCSKRGDFTATE